MPSTALKSRLALFAAAALFSTGGAAFKAIALTAWQVAGARSAVAAAALLIAIPEARRNWSWRMAPVATAYAVTLISFVVANRLTTAANAIFLQSAAPLYVLLLGPWLLRERLERAHLLYLLFVVAGLALVFASAGSPVSTAPDPHRGNVIAVLSGFTYALMLVGLRWMARGRPDNPAIAATAMGNLFAAAAAIPLAVPIPAVRTADVMLVLYLGVVQIGLAYVLLTRAIRYVPAVEATTLLVIEPVLSPLWAWLAHAETPGIGSLAGGALILSATVMDTWRVRTGK